MDQLILKIEIATRPTLNILVRFMRVLAAGIGKLNLCAYDRVYSIRGTMPGPPEMGQGSAEFLNDVDVYRSLNDLATLMFFFRGKEIEFGLSGNAVAEEAVRLQFLDGTSRRGARGSIYGWDTYDLRGFLERVGRLTLHFGTGYFRLHWSQQRDGRWQITQIEHLRRDDLQKVFVGIHRGQYRYVIRDPISRKRNLGVHYFATDELIQFCLEPPLAKHVGRSRLPEVQPLARRRKHLMVAMLAATYAGANPNDHRCWVDRARRIDIARAIAEEKSLGNKIRGILGGMSILTPQPLTKYYDVWATLNWHWRLACLRESLLRQFNDQVVAPFLVRNGLNPDAGLAVLNVPSASEWLTTIHDLENGRVNLDDAGRKLKTAD